MSLNIIEQKIANYKPKVRKPKYHDKNGKGRHRVKGKLDYIDIKTIAKLVTPRFNGYICRLPHPKQAVFMLLNCREAFYGGACGGGKSAGLLLAALQYVDVEGYNALLLRRTFPELEQSGGLISLSKEWLGNYPDVVWQEQKKRWIFPSGATVSFGHMQREDDKYLYRGGQYQFIGFDELTAFSESQYQFLFSRLRSLDKINIPLRMRSASNPGGEGHQWVKERFILNNNKKDRIFISAKLADNPSLNQEEYIKSLNELDPITRAQLLQGNWDLLDSGGLFKRHWFKVLTIDKIPANLRWIRCWDLAASVARKGKDPDWTASAKVAIKNGQYFVMVDRLRGTPLEVEQAVKQAANMDGIETKVYIEQEPGSSGINTIDNYRRKVLVGYSVNAYRPQESKVVRASPLASAAEAGNVYLINNKYTSDFLDELELFPLGAHDDMIDACSCAVNILRQRQADKIGFENSIEPERLDATRQSVEMFHNYSMVKQIEHEEDLRTYNDDKGII